ncbi:MAG: mechanosensitive ion channel family protein [Aquiluna sp.]|jgi:moderate conductance mechanosensitive channel|nr:mechanosensitive ion channel family protein [Aquiluna sp.]
MQWFEVPEAIQPVVRIIVILTIAITLRVVLKVLANRVVTKLRAKAEKGGVTSEQRLVSRSATVASISNNFATWAIAITTLVMILSELGVDTGALIAVTTILGAALGFGGQALVKDVISGIFIVFEDQYGVGDTVNLDGVVGVIEAVELRVTRVRDADGTLWYLRNGEILKVGNASQKRG